MTALAAVVPLFENLARLRRQWLRRMIREHDAKRVLVVDRHPGMAAEIRKRRQWRDQRVEWHQELINPPVQRVCIVVPPRGDAHTEVLLDALERWTKVPLLNPGAGRPLGIEPSMQQWRVSRIDFALERLQPITFLYPD